MRVKLTVLACLLALVYSCTGEDVPEETYGTSLTDFRVLVDGKEYQPIDTTGSQITVFVPGGTDVRHITAMFQDDAFSVTVKGTKQVSGETVNDFTDYKKGVVYRLESGDGKSKNYTVRVLATKLPAVSVVTSTPGTIKDKVNWRDATIRIGNTDGTFTELGKTGIRGRGNILGNDTYNSFVNYLNDMVTLIRESANRDTNLWSNEYFTLSGEVSPVKSKFVSKINWMDSQISGM